MKKNILFLLLAAASVLHSSCKCPPPPTPPPSGVNSGNATTIISPANGVFNSPFSFTVPSVNSNANSAVIVCCFKNDPASTMQQNVRVFSKVGNNAPTPLVTWYNDRTPPADKPQTIQNGGYHTLVITPDATNSTTVFIMPNIGAAAPLGNYANIVEGPGDATTTMQAGDFYTATYGTAATLDKAIIVVGDFVTFDLPNR